MLLYYLSKNIVIQCVQYSNYRPAWPLANTRRPHHMTGYKVCFRTDCKILLIIFKLHSSAYRYTVKKVLRNESEYMFVSSGRALSDIFFKS